jgi:IclR family KDG regulon transcriptional repressor
MPEQYIVQPVAKALQVLEYVAEEGRDLSLAMICEQTGLPKTTTFRYLQTLRRAGFVAYDPKSDRYRAGVRLWVLGQLAASRSAVCDVAIPIMKPLRDKFNETVNLAELDGSDVLYLEMVESRRSLRMQAKVGSRDPAYCTAVGKAMLAYVALDRLQEHLPLRLTSRTHDTITSLTTLRRELATVREQGVAVERGENEDGACCIGAPIFYKEDSVIAAISVSAPASRITRSLEKEISAAVIEAATAIAERLQALKTR